MTRTFNLLSSIAMTLVLLFTSCGSNKGILDGNGSLYRGETTQALEEAINSLLAEDSENDDVRFESIMVLKHGKVIYENWFGEAAPDIPHVMHSVSKSFTATAVGMLVDEGKLKLTDKVIDFFPEDLPEEITENLKSMTVRDILTMNCGHETEPGRGDGDWVKTFLAHPVTKTPGTWYCYNSMGTYMLSAIVQKITGEKLVDFLNTRLFEPLRIEKPEWQESPQGINTGGWGLYIKTEDMAKFGQLFLQKGEWNGKIIISGKWVEEASKYQVPSVPAGTRPDEVEAKGLTPENCSFLLGYGYQMWRCPMNAYRADGARGQYIMVLPDADAVIAVTADTSDLQAEQNLIYKYIFPVLMDME